MEGYLKLRINPILRRLITRLIAVIPAVLVILIYGEDEVDALLVFSQVILSVQLGFAVIPLIHFVSDKKTMGEFAIKPITKIAAWLIAAILIYLNVQMVIGECISFFNEEGNLFWKIIIILFALFFVWLFVMMTIMPLMKKHEHKSSVRIHAQEKLLNNLTIHPPKIIAIALDFGTGDEKLIANALAQGTTNTQYILIHIVESASTKYLGNYTDDDEARKDKERLENYCSQLQALGYTAYAKIGYRSRVKEIQRLVQESNANLLVMGAHRHSGLKDYLFGETIDSVRHKIDIPVLIVNM